MSAQPTRPAVPASPAAVTGAPAVPAAAAASHAIAPAGGAAYSRSRPASVPASNSGEYLSCVYADLATMCHRLARRGYGRALLISVVSPSQQRLPSRLSSVASATSSMSAPRIGSRPPALSSAAFLISMHPPAPAAVLLAGLLTLRKG